MGEYFPGKISIGGTIPRKVAEELCGRIRDENVGLEYGEHDFQPETPKDLAEGAPAGAPLDLYHEEASYGMFDDLEAFLVENGIAFDRCHDPHAEYDEEMVMFRPEMKEPRRLCADTSGKVMVRAEDTQKLIKALGRASERKFDAFLTAATVSRKLTKLIGADIPALGPFKVEE